MISNAALPESAKIVNGLSNTTPSTTVPAYVSLKNYGRATAIVTVKNGTTVTGSALTLKQATAVAGTAVKALAMPSYWVNLDTAASDALVLTNAVSNTVTSLTTNSKLAHYVFEVRAQDLDINNGFDVFQVACGDAANTTLTITYILRDPRYCDATPPTAVVD